MIGTTLSQTGSINLAGGTGGTTGGGGHLIYGSNNSSTVTATGVANTNTTTGPVAANPFIAGGPSTAYIPNLNALGTEIYGLSSTLTVAQLAAAMGGALPLTDVNGTNLASATAGLFEISSAALNSVNSGLPAFTGYDYLVYANLSAGAVTVPGLGVNGVLQQLENQGYAANPQFGGAGPTALPTIASGSVYATLVPVGTNGLSAIAGNGAGALASAGLTNSGGSTQALYLAVPEPSTFVLGWLGGMALFAVWRKRGAKA